MIGLVLTLLLLTGATCWIASPVLAQAQSESRGPGGPTTPSKKKPREAADYPLIQERETAWNRYLHSYLELPPWLDLGVDYRIRYESLDHPFRKGEFGTGSQLLHRTRARFGLNAGPFRFLAEFQDSRVNFKDAGEFVSASLTNKADMQQLFVSATAHNVLGAGLRTDLHVGRLNMDIGRRRLVARNDFRNTTNAFDGVHWSLGREKVWRFRAFLTSPVRRSLTDPDQVQTDTLFWGTFYENKQVPWLRANLYYFGLNDQRQQISQRRQYSTLGVRFYRLAKPGKVDYEIESAWQVGQRRGKDHFAHFQHIEVGYTASRLPWTPRLVAQYDYASGTANPNGNTSQTFDTLFGARRFEYMPTGTFGPFFRSNLSSPGWRLIVRPSQLVKLTLKHRAWYLAQARDVWVGSGLQDSTGQSGNYLGQDVELRVQWDPNANWGLDVGYDHFFKGSYIQNLARVPGNPPATDTDYFYFQTRIRF